MARWRWIIRQATRRIWFRAGVISILSIGLALVAAWVAPLVPYDLSAKIGAKAVDNILEILASSMLAVTTFSMTAMVSAYAGATSTITPRATQLLIRDATSQNALSTFLGGFIFAIVGICALSTGLYGEKGRVILFVGAIGVIGFIVFTLLRWIEHLSRFGRMHETIVRVERAASEAARALAHRPHLGGAPATPVPSEATAVFAPKAGYVVFIDVPALASLARTADLEIHIAVHPGAYADPARPLARVAGETGETLRRRIAAAFTLDTQRDYDQDPRFGLVVLGEIASRALSPAVNDPGTAIAVIGAGFRVLEILLREAPWPPTKVKRVHMPRLALEDLLTDLFRPIARDGASLVEVDLRLQKALGALAVRASPEERAQIAYRAADALARAEAGLASDADRIDVRAAYAAYWAA